MRDFHCIERYSFEEIYIKPGKTDHSYAFTLLMSKFCGLRSLCKTFRLWQKANPLNNWYLKGSVNLSCQCRARGGRNSENTSIKASSLTGMIWQRQGQSLHLDCRNISWDPGRSARTPRWASCRCAARHRDELYSYAWVPSEDRSPVVLTTVHPWVNVKSTRAIRRCDQGDRGRPSSWGLFSTRRATRRASRYK